LTRNLATVRSIIALQQNFARGSEMPETIPLKEVVEDALGIHSCSAAWNQIEIVRDYADATPVTLNRQQALHIVFNLLQNAQLACEEALVAPGRITVRTARGDTGGVRLEVIDNGIGIPPGNMSKLFTYGFTTRENRQGFGLHSATQLAGQMGGTLSAHSDGVSRGATFTLELPPNPSAANPP
jgi:signal transduction histidine kinase